jgi:hypothetical protein
VKLKALPTASLVSLAALLHLEWMVMTHGELGVCAGAEEWRCTGGRCAQAQLLPPMCLGQAGPQPKEQQGSHHHPTQQNHTATQPARSHWTNVGPQHVASNGLDMYSGPATPGAAIACQQFHHALSGPDCKAMQLMSATLTLTTDVRAFWLLTVK